MTTPRNSPQCTKDSPVPESEDATGRSNSCLITSVLLLTVVLVTVVRVAVWIYDLNRNPEPFPWSPVQEWIVPGEPLELHFPGDGSTLLVLCGDGEGWQRSNAVSIVHCDTQTGAVLSTYPLPHPACGVTMAAASDCVLVATVIPSPDDTSVRFTPDNKQLLSGHKGGIVRVWNLKGPL